MYKRVLSIQDISCVGQCSLTVALPIISACGHETAVLPSGILSTHTAGFSGYTFRDLTDDLPKIKEHWVKENIKFDCIYTGYLGSEKQIEYVMNIFDSTGKENCIKIVDPAMADNGKLYPAFDTNFVNSMKILTKKADYLIPNITEASFLTDIEYKETYNKEYVNKILTKLHSMGCKNVILTGISYKPTTTGVVISQNGQYSYYEHDLLKNSCHGTGDIYASAFVGALLKGHSAEKSAQIAADYTVLCIKETAKTDNHWYGAAFEPVLGNLITLLNSDR